MSMAFLGNWQFDPLSFWTGILLAAVAGFFLYRLRHRIAGLREAMGESYRTALEALTTTAAQGYRNDLLLWAQSSHIVSHLFALEEILLPPRLLVPPLPVDPDQPPEYDAPALFPFSPDWPQLAEAFGGSNIPARHLLTLKTHTLLAGLPGSGKTTVLAALTLEWLKRSLETGPAAAGIPRALFYANAHDLALPGSGKDALPPLAAAVQHYASTLSSSQIPSYIKGSLRGDASIVLLDAVDELPFQAQDAVREWVRDFIAQYPKTRMIVTISPEEVAHWRPMGFAVAAPSPWLPADHRQFMEQWGVRWQELVVSDRKTGEKPDPALLIGWISRQTLGLSPLDITLRIWAAFSSDLQGTTGASDQQAYISRHLPLAAEEAMAQVARAMIVENFSAPTRKQVETALALAWPHSEQSLPPVEDFFDAMIARGILRRRPSGRVTFGHLVIAARFAARAAAGEGNLSAFFAEAKSPLSDLTTQAVAATTDVATLVSARLSPIIRKEEADGSSGSGSMPPIVEDGWKLLKVASWLRDAPPTAGWRVEVFRRLMKTVRTASQPFPLRARALCAFLNSRDTSATQLFRQILSTEDSDREAQILAALGLGAMADQSAVELLAKQLESDSRELRWAGALALGHIATHAAIDTLGQVLLQGEDDLRRAVAEALALDPIEGHGILREAIQDAELLVRRAAVFGLSRSGQPWALEILERVQIEDGQWAVKSAAAQAVEKLHGEADNPLAVIPQPASLPWLVAFAAERKTGLAPGLPALAMLQRALREGEPRQRAAAVETLAHLGDPEFIPDLCMGLSDNESFVRSLAFEGLWSLRTRHEASAQE
ncbi:MAG: HEAT repeat domain-containing protein [Anaerolineales bacterium]|nr:HEAT repeat domain-containing protein [Anaerolineales bacterium]